MEKLYKAFLLFVGLTAMNITVQAQKNLYAPIFASSINYSAVHNWNNILSSTKHKHNIDFVNYPNPATTFTTVGYTLSERANVVLKVIDLAGKQLSVLIKQEQAAGKKEYYWEFARNNITSGMYILILQVDYKTYSRKIIVQ